MKTSLTICIILINDIWQEYLFLVAMRIPIGLVQQIATSLSRAFRKTFQEEYLAAKQSKYHFILLAKNLYFLCWTKVFYNNILFIVYINIKFLSDPKKWEAAAVSNFGNMDLSEAKKILNLDAIDDREALQEATDRLVNVSQDYMTCCYILLIIPI